MEIIDNINHLFGDDLKRVVAPGSKLRVAASCFSIYAFEALKRELESVESLQFIFTSPTFVPGEVTDRLRKEHREFHIPKLERERSLYGSEFEVRLRNELTQKAIAKECAEWMRKKAIFRSNRGSAPMQQFTSAVHSDGRGAEDIDQRRRCEARKFFAKITSEQVRFEVINSYGKLMELVK